MCVHDVDEGARARPPHTHTPTHPHIHTPTRLRTHTPTHPHTHPLATHPSRLAGHVLGPCRHMGRLLSRLGRARPLSGQAAARAAALPLCAAARHVWQQHRPGRRLHHLPVPAVPVGRDARAGRIHLRLPHRAARRYVETKADSGPRQRRPSGWLAETGRSSGQPAARKEPPGSQLAEV